MGLAVIYAVEVFCHDTQIGQSSRQHNFQRTGVRNNRIVGGADGHRKVVPANAVGCHARENDAARSGGCQCGIPVDEARHRVAGLAMRGSIVIPSMTLSFDGHLLRRDFQSSLIGINFIVTMYIHSIVADGPISHNVVHRRLRDVLDVAVLACHGYCQHVTVRIRDFIGMGGVGYLNCRTMVNAHREVRIAVGLCVVLPRVGGCRNIQRGLCSAINHRQHTVCRSGTVVGCRTRGEGHSTDIHLIGDLAIRRIGDAARHHDMVHRVMADKSGHRVVVVAMGETVVGKLLARGRHRDFLRINLHVTILDGEHHVGELTGGSWGQPKLSIGKTHIRFAVLVGSFHHIRSARRCFTREGDVAFKEQVVGDIRDVIARNRMYIAVVGRRIRASLDGDGHTVNRADREVGRRRSQLEAGRNICAVVLDTPSCHRVLARARLYLTTFDVHMQHVIHIIEREGNVTGSTHMVGSTVDGHIAGILHQCRTVIHLAAAHGVHRQRPRGGRGSDPQCSRSIRLLDSVVVGVAGGEVVRNDAVGSRTREGDAARGGRCDGIAAHKANHIAARLAVRQTIVRPLMVFGRDSHLFASNLQSTVFHANVICTCHIMSVHRHRPTHDMVGYTILHKFGDLGVDKVEIHLQDGASTEGRRAVVRLRNQNGICIIQFIGIARITVRNAIIDPNAIDSSDRQRCLRAINHCQCARSLGNVIVRFNC